jgi:hypothetical protein
LRLQDYRDITDAPFDAICSIEMVEAVGQAYWPKYFETVSRLLKPGGRACVQSIVIDDALFERYLQSTDFIQQYIFPGGCLPCPAEFRRQAQAAGLQVVDEFAFGADYAETLRRWRDAFVARRPRWRRWALTRASCASGSFTWPIAKLRLTPATSAWCSTPWSSHHYEKNSCLRSIGVRKWPFWLKSSGRCTAARAAGAVACCGAWLDKAKMTVWGFEVYNATLWVAPGFVETAYEQHAFALGAGVFARLCGQ